MPTPIEQHTLITRDQTPVTADMDGELVMMSIERGNYYGLGEVGSEIWRLLETPLRVSELTHILQEQYEVDATTCSADIITFLEQLHNEGLITLNDERKPG